MNTLRTALPLHSGLTQIKSFKNQRKTKAVLNVRLIFSVATLFFCLALNPNLLRAESPLTQESAADRPLNIIVILADDMGYGDTSHNGHPSIQTPHLDRMAYEGQKWTNFYAAASVCSPSRAALLTGRLPVRSGIASLKHRVFFPWSKGGMPQREVTIAELLKSRGYKTGHIGKWHLGHQPEFLPTQHGFDEWFGIPYSNDMDQTEYSKKQLRSQSPTTPVPTTGWYEPASEWFQVPLMRDEKILKRAPDQSLLTKRYTEEALDFIQRHKDDSFFLYLAFSMPHVPLFRSADFQKRSKAGLYGDVIEEIDDSVGLILKELRQLNLEQNTLVVFTSDNGPWLKYKTLGGSAGPLREGKSTAWEGGFRVPTIFWAPGIVSPQVIQEMGSTLDFMATFASLSNASLPGAKLDSSDLSSVLLTGGTGPREDMFFYVGDQLAAVRHGNFKAHFWVTDSKNRVPLLLKEPLLYNVSEDPSERYDLAASRPDILTEIERRRDAHLASVTPVENQLLRR